MRTIKRDGLWWRAPYFDSNGEGIKGGQNILFEGEEVPLFFDVASKTPYVLVEMETENGVREVFLPLIKGDVIGVWDKSHGNYVNRLFDPIDRRTEEPYKPFRIDK